MKYIVVLATAALCLAQVNSFPLSGGDRLRSEALDRLVMVEADDEAALRSKRTIGILRELFPEISQMIEQKVNAIVAEVIRAVGPTLIRNFIGNNGGGGGGAGVGGSSDGSTVTAKSPFDDDDDEDGDEFRSTSANGSKVSISLPTFPPDEDENPEETTGSTTAGTNAETTQDRATDATTTIASP